MLRLVENLGPRDHITSALQKLHWLPVPQRITFKLCVLVFLCLHNQAPPYLSSLLVSSVLPGRSSLRSSHNFELIVPRTKLKVSERAFSVSAPRAWNSLPVSVRSLQSLPQFKRALKTHLFSVAYGR